MHQRFFERMETGLKKLQAAMESGRLRDETVAHRRLGRLQGENSRAAKAFDVTIERVDAADLLDSQTNEEAQAFRKEEASVADLLETQRRLERMGAVVGRLLLVAQQPERNRSQDAVEALHPIDRSRMGVSDHEGRTGAATDLASQRGPSERHTSWCVSWLTRCGRHWLVGWAAAAWETHRGACSMNSPRSSPATSCCRSHQEEGRPPRTLRLRCVTEPDGEQKLFLHRLGLTLPKRLGSRLTGNQM